jgi:hypothetical protein
MTEEESAIKDKNTNITQKTAGRMLAPPAGLEPATNGCLPV